MKSLKVFLPVVVFLSGIGLAWLLPFPSFLTNSPTANKVLGAATKQVRERIVFGEPKPPQEKTSVFQAKQTALDLLAATNQIETKSYSFGKTVESIDGVRSENGKYWIYYINGQTASVGAGAYVLQPNDLIEWKLEKGQ